MTEKFTAFDAAAYIETPEAAAAFLADALETGDAGFIQQALGVLARAEGMTKVAQRTGLGRESLYKALTDQASPQFATVLKVLDALGLQLTVTPKAAA